MADAFVERRKSPRVTLAAGHELSVALSVPVQVLDVSASGVLLAAPQPLAPGQRGRLQARLGNDPLEADVEVRRVSGEQSTGRPRLSRYRLAVRFVGLNQGGRRSIERFLKNEESER